MKKIFLASAALLAFAATPAAAQNNFSGFRVEARLGYDSVSVEGDYADTVGALHGENDEDGFGFGAELGYDFALGPNFILGAYAGIDFTDSDFCTQFRAYDQACMEVGRNLTIGVRAGYQVGSSTLIYGRTGWSNGTAEFEFNDVDNIVNDANDSDSQNGWHFGLGVEQNFGPMFYGKLEYNRTVYSDADFASTAPPFALTIDGSRSQFTAGVGLRF
jgi:outer membrane immunogenic protein